MTKPLLVFAMKEESQDVFGDYNVLYTGIGKVNAAYGLMRYLRDNKPEVVINLGTAGSRMHAGGTLINPTSFVQRDMDVTPLGVEKFKTPFSGDPVRIEYGGVIEGLPQGVCGTGDNFDTSEEAAAFDVVDMEGYVLALICQREKIPFKCLKYVSDGADGDASQDWNDALRDTAQVLYKTLKGAGL